MHKQLSLFQKSSSNKSAHKFKPKNIDRSSWNYQSRLKHLVESSDLATWKTAFIATKHAIKRAKDVNSGKMMKTDYTQLEQALNELRISKTKPFKNGKYPSLRAIARYHHINKSTLYRHYVERYGKK